MMPKHMVNVQVCSDGAHPRVVHVRAKFFERDLAVSILAQADEQALISTQSADPDGPAPQKSRRAGRC